MAELQHHQSIWRSPLQAFKLWVTPESTEGPAHERLCEILYLFSGVILLQIFLRSFSPFEPLTLRFIFLNLLTPLASFILPRYGLTKVALDLHFIAFITLFSVFFIESQTDFVLLLPAGLNYVVLAYLGKGLRWAIAISIFFWSLLTMQLTFGLLDPAVLAYLAEDKTMMHWMMGLQMLQTLVIIYLYLVHGATAPDSSFGTGISFAKQFLARLPAPLYTLTRLILQYGQPPVFDDMSRTWQAARLYPLIISSCGVNVFSLIGLYFFSPTFFSDAIFCSVYILWSLFMLWWISRGNTRSAMIAMSVFWGLITALVALKHGGLHPASLAVWFGTTLTYITLISFSQGVILSSILLAFNFGMFWAQQLGVLGPIIPYESIHIVNTALGTLVNNLVVLYTVVKTMNKALVQEQSWVINYQQILALSPVGILVINEHGHVTTANASAYQVLGLAPTPHQPTHPLLEDKLSTLLNSVHQMLTSKTTDTHTPLRFETITSSTSSDESIHLEVHCALMQNLPDQANEYQVILVDTTELYRKETQIREHMEEREQLSQNLHDDILQTLYAHSLCLEDVQLTLKEQPEKAKILLENGLLAIDDVMQDIRVFLSCIAPPPTKPDGFTSSLIKFARALEEGGNIRISVDCPFSLVNRLTAIQTEQLLNIGRESLSNAVKHGHASTARVQLLDTEKSLHFDVTDNGQGFDLAHPQGYHSPSYTGHGLSNMRKRAAHINARLIITSQKGQGTRVRTVFALNRSVQPVQPVLVKRQKSKHPPFPR